MVFAGSEEETMAMGPERSKPLHNFMLPCLKWGTQRYLRCMKVASADAAGDRRSPAPVTGRKRELEASAAAGSGDTAARGSEKRMRVATAAKPSPPPPGINGDDSGIDAVREKLMLDLKTEADRMKDAIFRKEVVAVAEEDDDDVAPVEGRRELAPPPATASASAAAAAAEVRPWNLRTRRAACKAPAVVAGESGKGLLRIEEKRPNSSPLTTNAGGGGAVLVKSPKLRGSPEKMEKVKFSLPLSRKEVEEDFMELVGHRPPRRPKKRPRIVQKQLDVSNFSVFLFLF